MKCQTNMPNVFTQHLSALTNTLWLGGNSFAFSSNRADSPPSRDCEVRPFGVSLRPLRFMESSEKTEEIWIHGALNVFVNDKSQLAELNEKKKKKKLGRENELKGGRDSNVPGLMFCLSFSRRYSALIKAVHHIDHQPLSSKAKTTHSQAWHKDQQCAGGPIIHFNDLSGRGCEACVEQRKK